MAKYQVFRHDQSGRHPVGPMTHDELTYAKWHMFRCMRRAASGSRVGQCWNLLEVRPGVWSPKYWNAWRQPKRAAGIWFEVEQIEQIGE